MYDSITQQKKHMFACNDLIFYYVEFVSYSLNLNQSKSTDHQWNLTDSNSWKVVIVNQSNFTDSSDLESIIQTKWRSKV